MKTETRVTIILSERECRAAQVNDGIIVSLPPGTLEIILKVERDDVPSDDAQMKG